MCKLVATEMAERVTSHGIQMRIISDALLGRSS